MNKHVKTIDGQGGGLSGLFGGAASSPTTDPDNLLATSYATIVEAISEGPIVGLVNGNKSIYFNGTPLVSTDGTVNFLDSTVGFRFGYPDQDWLPDFSNTEAEHSVGVQVKIVTGAVVRTTANTDLDTVRVTIRLPHLATQDSKGNVRAGTVQYAIEYQRSDAGPWLPFQGSPFTINGKTTSGIDYQYQQVVRDVGDVAPHTWNIRVTRLTADHVGNTTISDDMVFYSYTEVITAKLTYPDTAYIGLQLPSTSFNGGIPVRTYDIYGRIIRIPTNYDPVARTYTGIWDGSFKLAWTDNPTWVLLDLLSHNRYGLGLKDSQIDIAGLYTISKYCDVLIDDGFGGTQPRYTINVCIQSPTEAYALVNKIVATFLTMPYYSAGGISFAQDAPRDTDMVVVPANVVDGMFNYQSQSYRDTPNTVLVSWTNPQLDNKGDIETVESSSDVTRRGAVTFQIEALGVTDRARAHRVGRWAVYTSFYDGEVITYKAGLDHATIVPGNIIQVFDPDYEGPGLSGRILSTSGSQITLDRPVTLSGVYVLSVVLPNLTVQPFAVTNGAGTYSTLTVSGTFPSGLENHVWALASTVTVPRKWRVLTKTLVGKTQYEIAAIAYHPDKYALIESDLAIDPDLYKNPVGTTLQPPSNLSVQEYTNTTPTGGATETVLLSWMASPDPVTAFYRVQAFKEGQFDTIAVTSNLQAEVYDLPLGTSQFRVRGESNDGRVSPWALATATLTGPASLSVTNFSAAAVDIPNGNGDGGLIPGIKCTWTPISAAAAVSVMVEYYPSGSPQLSTQIVFSPAIKGEGTIAGLQPTTTYFLRATPLLQPSLLPSTFTGYFQATTGRTYVYGPLDTAPGVPQNLTLSNTVRRNTDGTIIAGIAASWTAVSSANFLNYEVQLYTPTTNSWGSIVTGNSAYSWNGLNVGDSVNVRVRSISRLGAVSAFSSVASITVTGTATSPAAPTNLSTQAGFQTMGLSWTNPSDPDLYYVEIYRSTTNNVATAVLVGTAAGSSYADTGLATSTAYYYWIKAVNTSGLRSALYPNGPTGIIGTTRPIVGSVDLQIASVTTAVIAAQAITSALVNTGAITTSLLAAGAVTSAALAANAVQTANISDTAITNSKISDSAITNTKIAANAISTGQIQANAITAGQIAANTITAAQIAAGSITAGQIAANTITGNQIAARSIYATSIVSGSLTANEIAARSLSADRIAANSLTAYEVSARSLTADRIAAYALTATEIAARTIAANNIASQTLTANEIAGRSITADRFVAGSITAYEIAASSITADRLSVGSLSALSANLGTVTAGIIQSVDGKSVWNLNAGTFIVSD